MKAHVVMIGYDYEGYSGPVGVFLDRFPNKKELDETLRAFYASEPLEDDQYETLRRELEVETHRGQPGDTLHVFIIDAD